MKVTLSQAICLALCIAHVSAENTKLREAFAWKVVDYAWKKPEDRAAAIASGEYVPSNNLPLGLEVWKNKLFVTVPRWKSGVVSTLNYIKLDDKDEPSGTTATSSTVPTATSTSPSSPSVKPPSPTPTDSPPTSPTNPISTTTNPPSPSTTDRPLTTPTSTPSPSPTNAPSTPTASPPPSSTNPPLSTTPTSTPSPSPKTVPPVPTASQLQCSTMPPLSTPTTPSPTNHFEPSYNDEEYTNDRWTAFDEENTLYDDVSSNVDPETKTTEVKGWNRRSKIHASDEDGQMSMEEESAVRKVKRTERNSEGLDVETYEESDEVKKERKRVKGEKKKNKKKKKKLKKKKKKEEREKKKNEKREKKKKKKEQKKKKKHDDSCERPDNDATTTTTPAPSPEECHPRSPALIPYPSFEANRVVPGMKHETTPITSVFRLKADSCDRLWVMDTGVADILGETSVISKPRVLIYNLNNDTLIKEYELKDSDTKESSFFANIVVDVNPKNCDKAFAYIPDLGGYAIVVYDYANDKSWRIQHNYFHFDPLAGNMNIGGINFQWTDGVFSIALAKPREDGSRTAYFHALASTKEFEVDTKALQQGDGKVNYYDYKLVGDRGEDSQSSASFIHEDTGVMFYTQLQKDGVYCWNTNKNLTVDNIDEISSDNETMIFTNDLKVDAQGKLWVLTDRLPTFIYKNLDDDEVNYRIFEGSVDRIIAGTKCAP